MVYLEIYHNDILQQIIKDGIKVADEEYIVYSATTGQVRDTTVTLLKKTFFERHIGFLLVGLTIEKINLRGGMNVGKYLSYTALPLSSSVLPDKEIDIDRCIVVKGLETIITDKVKYIEIQMDSAGQCYVADIPKDSVEKGILIEHTDGAGMFLPGEIEASCQIRSGYFKGAMFPFDFRQFSCEVAHNAKILDAWGNEVDVEENDIRFIFTTSQLKMWKMYDSWEEYKRLFKENNLQITINSYANPAKEVSTFAYQYLQTLPYGSNVEGICTKAKKDLFQLHSDIDYVMEAMGYTSDLETELNGEESSGQETTPDEKSERIIKSSNSFIAKAIAIYPQLIYDPYIMNKIQKMVQAKRKSYLGGKIPLEGYYSYAAPDMFAFCEYLFCKNLNPVGLVPKDHIYNKYYVEKGNIENLVCLRSPHLSRYEYGKRRLAKSQECKKWFQHMETDTIVSCHDLLSKTLQMDWDGDEILVSPDKELYQLVDKLPNEPLYYDMQVAESQVISDETIYDTLIKGFDNNVIGDSSNAITKLCNTPIATEENPIPYDDAINVICAFSNYGIDYPKTGKSLDLGDYKKLYSDLVPEKEGKTRFEEAKIKYPFFFKYAKNKKSRNLEKVPTKSVMNDIFTFIAKGTGRLKYNFFDDKNSIFNYGMLMNNEVKEDGKPRYYVYRYSEKYKRLFIFLKERKLRKQSLCRMIDNEKKKKNIEASTIVSEFETFHYFCIRGIEDIFTNKNGFFNVNLAVNYLVDMEYREHEFSTSSKDILWKCFGHILIENLCNNVQSDITVKTRPRMAYIKACKGEDELDEMIKEKMKNRSINITSHDLSFINEHLQKCKNGNYYKNDKELLFVLYCLYKEAKENGRLNKDGYLIITQKKHTTNFNAHGKTQKKKVFFNMNRIMQMACVSSFQGSLKRLKREEGIEIIEDGEKRYYKIKFNIPDDAEGEVQFNVADVYNPMVYFQAYKKKQKIYQCRMCGKDFLRESNNQKTCSKTCSDKLSKWNQLRVNEKKKEERNVSGTA